MDLVWVNFNLRVNNKQIYFYKSSGFKLGNLEEYLLSS